MEELTRQDLEDLQIAVTIVMDHHSKMGISPRWEALYKKLERMVEACLTKRVSDKCPSCDGVGWLGNGLIQWRCPYCHGAGIRR